MFKRIYSLDPKKATNANDLPKDILIGSNDIVCGYISDMFNKDKNDCCFPQILKTGDVNPQLKMRTELLKGTTDQLAIISFCQSCAKVK